LHGGCASVRCGVCILTKKNMDIHKEVVSSIIYASRHFVSIVFAESLRPPAAQCGVCGIMHKCQPNGGKHAVWQL
jgi:hypothetical protein